MTECHKGGRVYNDPELRLAVPMCAGARRLCGSGMKGRMTIEKCVID
jgi:hypothetical protein